MRRMEWLFVFLFIASGLYCLGVVAGLVTYRLPLPDWFQAIGSYLGPYKWVIIVLGIVVSLWSLLGNRHKE
jgi:hypothetical protein